SSSRRSSRPFSPSCRSRRSASSLRGRSPFRGSSHAGGAPSYSKPASPGASFLIQLERHQLGPRVYVLGRRAHEWQLGAVLLAVLVPLWRAGVLHPLAAGRAIG